MKNRGDSPRNRPNFSCISCISWLKKNTGTVEITSYGPFDARAEEQIDVADSRQGYAAGDDRAEGASCERMAVQGVRQEVRRPARCGGSQGEDDHRHSRMLLASARLQGFDNAQDECRVLDGEVVEERQNVRRDRRNEAAWRDAGWNVIVVWECALTASRCERTLDAICAKLGAWAEERESGKVRRVPHRQVLPRR